MSENSTISHVTTTSVTDFNISISSTIPIAHEELTSIPTTPTTSTTTISFENVTLQDFNGTTTTTIVTTEASLATEPAQDVVTESVHKFQSKIWAQDGYGGYIPYDDEQYTTPTSILFLNFFLIIFLMIVIGIAVYPAVKKYCDSTFFQSGGNGNRYWIEDNEEVISVLTSNIPECSFALLNRTTNEKQVSSMAVSPDDSSSACSMDVLTEVRRK